MCVSVCVRVRAYKQCKLGWGVSRVTPWEPQQPQGFSCSALIDFSLANPHSLLSGAGAAAAVANEGTASTLVLFPRQGARCPFSFILWLGRGRGSMYLSPALTAVPTKIERLMLQGFLTSRSLPNWPLELRKNKPRWLTCCLLALSTIVAKSKRKKKALRMRWRRKGAREEENC